MQARLFRADIGAHRFDFKFNRQGGEQVGPTITQPVEFKDCRMPSTVFFFDKEIAAMVLPFGEYFFEVEYDGKPVSRTPLYILQSHN
jgi:hypothetical protein